MELETSIQALKKPVFYLRKIISAFCTVFIFFSAEANEKQLLRSNFTEKEYAQVEDIYYRGTNHIELITRFINDQVVPELAQKGDFLDVGAGPGYITDLIAPHFGNTTIIEPNPSYDEHYAQKGYRSYKANFQDLREERLYDFILCSHVMYHVEIEQWGAFLQKAYNSLQSEGKALIALVAPRGAWHELRSFLNREYAHSAKAIAFLEKYNLPHRVIKVVANFTTPSYDDFRQLVYLFTVSDCFTEESFERLSEEEKEAINDKIEEFISSCRKFEGSYELIHEDDYILICK